MLQQLDPQSPGYDVHIGVEFRGEIDAGALERALEAVQCRHEVLRTVLAAPQGLLRQIILPRPPQVPLAVIELPGATDDDVRTAIAEQFTAPPDLERGPLLRAVLFRLAPADHVLGIAIHLCVSDGWSIPLLGEELLEHYAAFTQRREPSLLELPIQYADYAAWQRDHGQAHSDGLAYWRQVLADTPPPAELPADRPRPASHRPTAGLLARELGSGAADDLRSLAAGERATAFMIGLAAFAAVLARCSGQPDMVIATATAGRSRAELRNLIGCFLNTLALRIDIRDNSTFRELVGQAKNAVLQAFVHQDVPFELVVQSAGPARDRGHNPFTRVAFSATGPEGKVTWRPWPGMECRIIDMPPTGTAFDLTLVLRQLPGRLGCHWTYASEVFDEAAVTRLAGYFGRFLTQALARPDLPLREISLLEPGQSRFLVHDLNDTAAPVPAATLESLVAAQAARTPAAPALTCAGTTISYGELDARVNRLAWLLHEHGVGAEQPVAILLPRSLDMVAATIAVLRAGGAYVPLEPAQPDGRLGLMLADSGARLAVTSAPLLRRLPRRPGLQTILVDAIAGDEAAPPAGPAPPGARPSALAYIIYTSGSTGTPKGVAVTHRQAVNVLTWINSSFAVGSADRLLFVTSCGFDLSVYDVFGALATGAHVVVASDADLRDPWRLLELVRNQKITIWDSAPALLQQVMLLPEAARPTAGSMLRLALLSGDWIPLHLPDQVRSAFPGAEVIALGGATEATIWSNAFRVGEVRPEWASIPYGRPIRNARYYVLDDRLEPVPPGVAGDLYIGGEVLARGYHGRSALTAERFIADPYAPSPGQRMYATGDCARVAPDGTIEFLGRRDSQVKLRGFRVELGEVEAALASHPDVAACAVTASGPRGELALTGYVVCGDRTAGDAELRTHLARQLPDYMVPSTFITLDALPLTPNGKLDRARLPHPAERRAALEQTDLRGTRFETEVADIWSEILGLDHVGLDEDFFEIGGHSLLALQVVLRVRERFHADISGGSLIANQTLRSFAAAVEAAVDSTGPASPLQRLRSGQGSPAVVLVHPVGGGVACYAGLATHLDGHDIYAFEARRPPSSGLTELAAGYVAELVRSGPRSRYVLGGWSLGGTLALEIALELSESGHGEPPVVLMDPLGAAPPPDQRTVTEQDLVLAFIQDLTATMGLVPPVRADLSGAEPEAVLEKALDRIRRQDGAAGLDLAELVSRYQIFRGHALALIEHSTSLGRSQPPVYDGPVYLIEAAESQSSADYLLRVCASLSVFQAPGDHFGLLRGDNAAFVAGIVTRALKDLG
ncbi:MAG: non-ribosomal peptide synthetase [Streptosporangiaceae bacterium]